MQTLTGKVVTLEVQADATVATLKTQLNQQIDAAEETQSLFFNGVELDDAESAAELAGATLNLVMRLRGGVMMEPSLQVLARKSNCDKKICRKCYARLPPRAHNCRSKMCGHTSELRPKKKLK